MIHAITRGGKHRDQAGVHLFLGFEDAGAAMRNAQSHGAQNVVLLDDADLGRIVRSALTALPKDEIAKVAAEALRILQDPS